jgi:hypothetical protein
MEYNTEFSNINEGTVTVTVNVPASMEVKVTPGNFTEFGIVLTCTSANAANISGTYWDGTTHSLEVSTYQDLDYTISFSQAGVYTFSESAKGYTGSSGSGSASVDFTLTAP